jgi:GMP synthase-like glutamine amidotransferase
LQHHPVEDLGCIAPWLAQRGARVTHTALFAGERLPELHAFDWLIVMGGPMNVDEHERYPWLVAEKALIREALEARRTVLGICLGAQLLATQLGASVRPQGQAEIGWYPVRLDPAARAHSWLQGGGESLVPLHWHGDSFSPPPGTLGLGRSEACAQQGFILGHQAIGLQFHPELTAADLRRWCMAWPESSGPWVQPAAQLLGAVDRFAQANRWMVRLLDRMAATAGQPLS